MQCGKFPGRQGVSETVETGSKKKLLNLLIPLTSGTPPYIIYCCGGVPLITSHSLEKEIHRK